MYIVRAMNLAVALHTAIKERERQERIDGMPNDSGVLRVWKEILEKLEKNESISIVY